jgi:predicted Rossmann fold nucleotide-binding protein DprA/Smf involved in DNA uptake
VLDLLPANEVKSIDDFVEALNLSPAEIISLLMGLVLKDQVRDEGGLYRKI